MTRNEDKEQKAVAKWLDWHDVSPWTHVAHEGKRHKAYAKKLKEMGTKPGVPDVVIFKPPPEDPDKNGTAIELKRRDGYRSDVTEYQEEWLRDLEESNWVVEVCFGSDEAIETLKKLGYGK